MVTSAPRKALGFFAAIAAAAHLLFLVLYRIDSDEPQHLHVVWGWSRGLVPYRDVFDNHLPLLHLLFAPLMRVMPESSSVFLLMRLAIAPFAIGCALLLYSIARPLLGRERAAFAAILFSVMPVWLAKSVEFRNDTLWIFFWLAAVALIAARPRPAYLLAGLAAGLCVLASIKALPLLLAHLLALQSQRGRASWKAMLRVTAGFALPLAALAALLYARGALADMLYCTLFFNAAAPVDAARRISGATAFAVIGPALAWRGTRLWNPARSIRAWQPLGEHLALFAAWYAIVLCCFWPILTPRDFLPLVPLAALWIAARVTTTGARAAAFTAAIAISVFCARLWQHPDRSRHRFVDAAVAITGENDYVFDLKGDAVFRRRPVHYIYEIVGRALTQRGVLADSGPEEIVAHRACVAIADSPHIPRRTRAFLNAHFVDAGGVRVCGCEVRGAAFTIAVPQTYAVAAADPARVAIDGVPFRGPRFLAAGPHTIDAGGNANVKVVWWRAVRSN